MSSWVRYHFEHLRRWREYAVAVMRAARDLIPGVRVFVIGGVAEGRTTVLSDIDILIIIPREVTVNKGRLYRDILIRAMDVYGLPWDAPVELHIVNDDEGRYYFESSSRVIEIDDGSR
ncbi:nucleotidyltransferase domain-containing protein [Vulcanisaeta distributa]|uniref:DNA polymerase beta domain protein region n=1 Tax=Vulcanisaeta distributa (strain DSM 14429 / JCM 11212 / NBRC 100878 / IC-017) TaxID=572478 RepID=E1QSF1_VULDI|nr:nucleotidyltransferase domain-containing protein [Vulcanisaeta distributa]ADN50744.1 DNA polymerase beta domain protein region [Vulcanisaeta distributa DSM 14429]